MNFLAPKRVAPIPTKTIDWTNISDVDEKNILSKQPRKKQREPLFVTES